MSLASRLLDVKRPNRHSRSKRPDLAGYRFVIPSKGTSYTPPKPTHGGHCRAMLKQAAKAAKIQTS